MAHDVFAPSSSSTWLNCSWSARHAVPEPPKPEKTRLAAASGSELHDWMDAAISGGEIPEDADRDKAEAVALGVDFVRQLEPGQRFTEIKGELAPGCTGTTDLLNLHPYIVTVMDHKFGKWDVDAYHNTQELTYAAMHLRYSPAPWWRLVIYQPFGLDEMPFKQWVASRSEVEAHKQRVLAAMADRSPPKPGPWCRWCKAFQQCPAMSVDAGFVIGAMSRPIESLTTEEIVRLLRLVRALNDVRAVYEDALTTHLKMGRTAEGANLKPQRSFRAWNDPIQAAQYLYGQYGGKGVKPISPAQAEKLGLAGKQYAIVGAHKPEGQMKATY